MQSAWQRCLCDSDKLVMLVAAHVKLSAPSPKVLKACCYTRRYITVDGEAGRALFYILVEAEGGAAGKPLILWTNGGPGCASSGGGFIAEHGPWYPNAYVERNGLRRNDYAWNRAASVLYLDQPAFTGFSYSNRSSDRYAGTAASLSVMCVSVETFMAVDLTCLLSGSFNVVCCASVHVA